MHLGPHAITKEKQGKESSWVTWSYSQREFERTSAAASGKTFPLAVNKHYRHKQDHANYKKIVLEPWNEDGAAA